MNQEEYLLSLFAKEDAILASINPGLAERELPLISLERISGKLLYLLVKMTGTKKILEIGALGGYSAIWMARAMPKDGELLSLELDEQHIDFAKENIKKAGLTHQIQFMKGDAQKSLERLESRGEKFDFIFIDADKEGYPQYLEKSISLASPGAIITADNLLFGGKVLDPANTEPATEQIRMMNQQLADDPRIESLVIPIGDGVGIARVKES